MEAQVDRLVSKAWDKYKATPTSKRLLIGIAGIPGSGKTTFSQILTKRLNALASQDHGSAKEVAAFLPMDGFHLTRAALSAMPNPEQAHARRGAAFTFDAPKFLTLVQALRLESPTESIMAPSFDHAIKDPRDSDIAIVPTHRIVVLEGNYLALDRDVWREASSLLDELWFVEVDFDVARKRLRERHVRAGLAKTLEEGDRRATENDLVNGQEIVDHRLKLDEIITSTPDGSWSHD